MAMTSCMFILTMVAVFTICTCASPMICSLICRHKAPLPALRNQRFYQNCKCEVPVMDDSWVEDVRDKRNITDNGATTMSVPTTTDICDYLCSIQLGGEACQCSSPGLPGRKRKRRHLSKMAHP